MEFNLKNLKERVQEASETSDFYAIDPSFKEWLEGFEKELRAQLIYGEKAAKAWRGANKHRIDEELAMEWQGANQKIKEILGKEEIKK